MDESQLVRGITDPIDSDVLCGRGGGKAEIEIQVALCGISKNVSREKYFYDHACVVYVSKRVFRTSFSNDIPFLNGSISSAPRKPDLSKVS